MAFERFPIRRLIEHPSHGLDRRTWPATLAPVATILDRGLDLGPATVLADHLQVIRNAGSTRRGYFLRAETMHGFFTYLEANPSTTRRDAPFHEMSTVNRSWNSSSIAFADRGCGSSDEPESALSFSGCLALLGVLKEIVASGGSQVILSTHSPLLAALPQAQIFEVGSWGLRERRWKDLELVDSWQAFLTSPERYLRHL
ncbi:AAA family ATPase [Arthrobacter echini]|uniref:AAA family ATPase n=1 Tax=Arthrobacter echini TaxID=1529066 RepID=UPI0026C10A3F